MNPVQLLAVARTALQRRQSLTFFSATHQQGRTLSLYQGLLATTTLGWHRIQKWQPYKFPSPHQVEINLQRSPPPDNSSDDTPDRSLENPPHNPPDNPPDIPPEKHLLKLNQVLKDVQPGSFIVNTVKEDPQTLKTAFHASVPSKEVNEKLYKISGLVRDEIGVNRADVSKRGKSSNPFKRFQFTPSSANTVFFATCMRSMYGFMQQNLPVEVSLCTKLPADLERMVKDNPQLHPEAILAAMPKMSGIIIEPHTDSKKISWVMQGPKKGKEAPVNQGTLVKTQTIAYPKNLTRSLDKFRDNVKQDIEISAKFGARSNLVDSAVAVFRKQEAKKERVERRARRKAEKDIKIESELPGVLESSRRRDLWKKEAKLLEHAPRQTSEPYLRRKMEKSAKFFKQSKGGDRILKGPKEVYVKAHHFRSPVQGIQPTESLKAESYLFSGTQKFVPEAPSDSSGRADDIDSGVKSVAMVTDTWSRDNERKQDLNSGLRGFVWEETKDEKPVKIYSSQLKWNRRAMGSVRIDSDDDSLPYPGSYSFTPRGQDNLNSGTFSSKPKQESQSSR